MIISRVLFSLFLLFVFSAPVVVANPVAPVSTEEGKNIEAIPDPFSMQGEWWLYVDPSQEDFTKRVDQLKQSLAQLIDRHESEIETELNSDIQLIYGYLDNLEKSVTSESEINIPELSYKDNYEFKEFEILFVKYHSLINQRDSLIKQKEDEIGKSRKALDDINQLVIKYKDITENTADKLALGLKIMSRRLSWFVWERTTLRIDKMIAYLDEQVISTKKEIEYAVRNLQSTAKEIASIEKIINSQDKTIQQMKNTRINARKTYAKNLGIDYLSRVKLNLYAQQLMLAEIKENSAVLEQAINRVYKSLLLLNDHNKNTDRNQHIKVYDNAVSLYQEVLGKIDNYKEEILSEQNSLQNFIASDLKIEQQRILDKILEERADAVKDTLGQLAQLESSLVSMSLLNNVFKTILGDSFGLGFKLRNTGLFLFEQTFVRVWQLLNTSLFELSGVPVTSWDIIQALFILVFSYIAARFLQNILIKLNTSSEGKIPPAIYTLSRIIFYLIIVLGGFSAFASIGVNFTNLAIVAGALSVGIGFGLQSVVNNFVSGIIILFEQNIKKGDFVELDSGLKGSVRDINVRCTIVNTLDNLDIIVPNSELVASRVTNYTLHEPIVRIHIPFGVSYASDKETVKKAVLEASRRVEITYDDSANRRPQVWLTGFGDSSLNFELVTWLNPKLGKTTPGSWKALYNWEIESALKRYGIEIPYPQRDLHIKSHYEQIHPQQL